MYDMEYGDGVNMHSILQSELPFHNSSGACQYCKLAQSLTLADDLVIWHYPCGFWTVHL